MSGLEDAAKPVGMLLGQIIEAWSKRNEWRAAARANELTFWRDGMLAQLEKIARGEGNPETFAELRKNFDGSKKAVTDTMEKLRTIRNQIGPGRMGNQIDHILNDSVDGKISIRDGIAKLLAQHKRDPTGPVMTNSSGMWAEDLCRAIGRLNAELARLQRMAE